MSEYRLLDAARGSAMLRDAITRCMGGLPPPKATKKRRYTAPSYWTEEDNRRLASLAAAEFGSVAIGRMMGRTAEAVRAKAMRLGISLNRNKPIPVERPADISMWTEADKIAEWAEVPQDLAELVVTMAKYRGVKVKELRSASRDEDMVRCRREIANAARQQGYSYPKIGRALNRDHTSVIYLVKTKFSSLSTGRSAFVPCSGQGMIAA